MTDRVDRGREIADHYAELYYPGGGEEPATVAYDIIADLLHWVRYEAGADSAEYAYRLGHDNYEAEQADSAGEDGAS